MDFVLDPVVAKSTNNSTETLTEGSNDEINKKTEQEFTKFEDKIEETYNIFLKATSGWGSSLTGFLGNVKLPEGTPKSFEDALSQGRKQVEEIANKTRLLSIGDKGKEKLNPDGLVQSKKMLDLLSGATNSYLDDLDKELEQVENFAGTYASKVGNFFKNAIIEDPKDASIDAANVGDLDANESSVLFNVPENIKTPIYATRTDAQLNALHTSQSLYLTDAADEDFDKFKSEFDLEGKTNDITELLKKHPSLQNLMSLIVPTKVTYEEFWIRYYYMHNQILKQEEKRKQLLENENDDDEFNWDEEEEEQDSKVKAQTLKPGTIEPRSSSEITYDLKSNNSSTLDVVASKRQKKTSEADDNDEDDDDDWE